jgi:hypothetical protein
MRTFWLPTLAAVALAACSKGAAPTNAAAANTVATATNAAQVAPAPAPSAKLARVFTPDVLGSNVAYLETITGPAFRTDGSDRTYKIDGCTVIVGATNGKIDNIGIDGYSATCSFPIQQYFATDPGFAVPRNPTFGDLKKDLGGDYGATCLRLCGNAADPLVILAYSGSHADGFTDLYAAVTIADDGPALDAFTDWGNKLVAKHGEPYVATGQYAAGDSAQDVAAADFAKVSPTIVRVGTNLPGAAE